MLQSCALPDCAGGPQVVAAGLIAPRGLSVNTDGVYWSSVVSPDNGQAAVMQCTLPACTGGPTKLQQHLHQPYGTAVTGNRLLWTALDRVFSCDLPSCSTPRLLATVPGAWGTFTLATDGRVAVWYSGVDLPDGTSEGRLTSVALP